MQNRKINPKLESADVSILTNATAHSKQAPRINVIALARLVGLMFAMAAPQWAHAMKFSNQFVEFELPFKWQCALESAEWVCQSVDDQKKRDAIIVLAAKIKGEQDSLDKYQEYLNQARVFATAANKNVTSQPRYTKVAQINGHPWVDSLHLESEIPNFYTRYLATVKQDIGVLVTYSINKTKYQEYLPQFEDMVKSMKVFRKAGGVNMASQNSLFGQAQLPSHFTANAVFPDGAKPADSKPATTVPKGDDDNLMLVLIAGAAIVGFIIWKKKKGRG